MLFLDLVFSSYRVTVQDAQVLSRNKNHPTRFEFDINCKDRIRPYLNKHQRVLTKSFSRSSRAGRERFPKDYKSTISVRLNLHFQRIFVLELLRLTRRRYHRVNLTLWKIRMTESYSTASNDLSRPLPFLKPVLDIYLRFRKKLVNE